MLPFPRMIFEADEFEADEEDAAEGRPRSMFMGYFYDNDGGPRQTG